ncbi:MAG: YHS domain-containing protein [Melioribacteraceae bacterium]|jgi:YHS domain-containing protein|nr:YHS domain-containing protein [Melioribacteraceae bacterium]MCO6474596.1 YHS domain-containing protein [Melioribacteraceae bacterium]
MELDPVCGMKLSNIFDTPRSAYKGRVIYFCCPKCKGMFDTNPDAYTSGIHFEFSYSNPKPDKCDCNEKVLSIRPSRR